MEPKQRTYARRWCLLAIVIVYAAIAMAYNVVTPAATPVQHNPDENAHMLNVQAIAAGQLPVFRPNTSYEGHQPPLYYILCTPIYMATRGAGDAVAMRTVRCLSILLVGIALVVSYRAVRAILPEMPVVALGTALFIGWLPGVAGLAASVSNDSLMILVTAVCVWLLARSAEAVSHPAPLSLEGRGVGAEGFLYRLAVAIGVVLGLGIWTKALCLPLFPMVAMFYLLLAYRKSITGMVAARAAGISCGLGLLIATPWFIHNTITYGDPLAQKLLTQTLNDFQHNMPADLFIARFGMVRYLEVVGEWSFASYWAQFDSFSLFWNEDPLASGQFPFFGRNPGLFYQICALVSVVSLIGVGLAFRRAAGSPGRWCWLCSLVVLVAFTMIAFLRYNLVFFQCQGRYWYPALVAFTILFVLGWSAFAVRQRVGAVIVGLIGLGLLALNAYSIFALLIPRFGG